MNLTCVLKGHDDKCVWHSRIFDLGGGWKERRDYCHNECQRCGRKTNEEMSSMVTQWQEKTGRAVTTSPCTSWFGSSACPTFQIKDGE